MGAKVSVPISSRPYFISTLASEIGLPSAEAKRTCSLLGPSRGGSGSELIARLASPRLTGPRGGERLNINAITTMTPRPRREIHETRVLLSRRLSVVPPAMPRSMDVHSLPTVRSPAPLTAGQPDADCHPPRAKTDAGD